MEFDFEESLGAAHEDPAPIAATYPAPGQFASSGAPPATYGAGAVPGPNQLSRSGNGTPSFAAAGFAGGRPDGRRKKRDRVCMYWIRGGCVKGDACDFLHEDNPDKMPECQYGLDCRNRDCKFLHTGADESMRVGTDVCPDFAAGFCPLGQSCRQRHHTKPAEQRPSVSRDYTAQSRAAEVNRQRGVKVLPDYHTLGHGHGRSHQDAPREGEAGDKQYQLGGPLQELALGQGTVSRRGAEACVVQPWAPCATVPDARSLEMPWRTFGARLGCPDAVPAGSGSRGGYGHDSAPSFYFVVKAADALTLRRSVKLGAWACTSEHASRVNRALRIMDHPPGSPGAPRVFLFFSVVGSKYFQGVAQVTSGIRDARHEPCLFGVQWHRMVKLPFRMCANLVSEPAMHDRIVRSSNFQPLPSVLGHSLMLLVFLRPALVVDVGTDDTGVSTAGQLAEDAVAEPWVLVSDAELELEDAGHGIPPSGTSLPPMPSREQGRLMKRVETIARGGEDATQEARLWAKEVAPRKNPSEISNELDRSKTDTDDPPADLVAAALQHRHHAQRNTGGSPSSSLVSLGVHPGPWVSFQALQPPVVLPLLPAAIQQHGGAVQAAAAEWVHGGEGPAPPSLPGVPVAAPGDLPQQQQGGLGEDAGQSAVELLTQSQATHVPIVAPQCGRASHGVLVVSLSTEQVQAALLQGRLGISSPAALEAIRAQGTDRQLAGMPVLLLDRERELVFGLFAVAGRGVAEAGQQKDRDNAENTGSEGAEEDRAASGVIVPILCVAECPPMGLKQCGDIMGGAVVQEGALPPPLALQLAIQFLNQWPVPMALALVLVQRQTKLAWLRGDAKSGIQIMESTTSDGMEGEEPMSNDAAQESDDVRSTSKQEGAVRQDAIEDAAEGDGAEDHDSGHGERYEGMDRDGDDANGRSDAMEDSGDGDEDEDERHPPGMD